MTGEEIRAIVARQRAYFYEGHTLDIEERIKSLGRLKKAMQKYEKEIGEAIQADLGKSAFESYMCETGITLSEISYMEKHTRKFAKEKRVKTPLAQYVSRSYKLPSPHGVVLIMSPWNYPVLLSLEPLVDAVAAGNTVVLKPSAYSPNTSAIIERIVQESFPPEHVTVVTGGREENTALLEEKFDYIFFTGSQAVGKIVMEKASRYLTPVTLELGGKSPCIVDKTANIKLAAKRIVWGKYLNCGQTCVAPDYIYCDGEIKDELIEEIIKQIRKQFGKDPLQNKNYGKIINDKHFNRIVGLIDPEKVVVGGRINETTCQIAPTVMNNVTFDDAIMQEEIFGPVLPILTYTDIVDAVGKINSMAHPLALYIFSSDKTIIDYVTNSVGFGGGCVNDTIIHLATSEMGFGGFGESGMGSYHGKDGFDTFSHYKSIVDKKTWLDLPMRYQPFRKINEMLIHFFLK